MMAVEEEPIYKTHYVLDAPKGATVNKVLALLEAQGVKGGAYTIRTSERVAGDGSTMYGVTYTLLGLGDRDHERAFPPGSDIFRVVPKRYLCLDVESRVKPAGSPDPEKDKYDHFMIGLSEEWTNKVIPQIIVEVQKALSGR